MAKYDSFYQLLHGDESIPHKAHFIENFSGSVLDPRWTQTNILNTNTWAINDVIDGGLLMTNNTASGSNMSTNFNNIRQYDNTNSVCISILRRNTEGYLKTGFKYDAIVNDVIDNARYSDASIGTVKQLQIGNATTSSSVDTDIPDDTNWTLVKIELFSTKCDMDLDNSLKATSTVNLPSKKLQPDTYQANTAGGTDNSSIRYMECYNK